MQELGDLRGGVHGHHPDHVVAAVHVVHFAGIARAAHAHGAELGFTFQGEALEKRVRPLAQSIGSDTVVPCDVADDESIDGVFRAIEERWGKLDFLVHAIAYSDKDELKGQYLNTSRILHERSVGSNCRGLPAPS